MKQIITKEQQKRINELLDARKNRAIKSMVQSRPKTKDEDICTMLQYEYDNTIGSETSRCGMTYLEVEQFNNTYNNF